MDQQHEQQQSCQQLVLQQLDPQQELRRTPHEQQDRQPAQQVRPQHQAQRAELQVLQMLRPQAQPMQPRQQQQEAAVQREQRGSTACDHRHDCEQSGVQAAAQPVVLAQHEQDLREALRVAIDDDDDDEDLREVPATTATQALATGAASLVPPEQRRGQLEVDGVLPRPQPRAHGAAGAEQPQATQLSQDLEQGDTGLTVPVDPTGCATKGFDSTDTRRATVRHRAAEDEHAGAALARPMRGAAIARQEAVTVGPAVGGREPQRGARRRAAEEVRVEVAFARRQRHSGCTREAAPAGGDADRQELAHRQQAPCQLESAEDGAPSGVQAVEGTDGQGDAMSELRQRPRCMWCILYPDMYRGSSNLCPRCIALPSAWGEEEDW